MNAPSLEVLALQTQQAREVVSNLQLVFARSSETTDLIRGEVQASLLLAYYALNRAAVAIEANHIVNLQAVAADPRA